MSASFKSIGGGIKGVVLAAVLVVMSAVMIYAQTAGGGGGRFTDSRDNKTYRTVRIGNQTWMAENLNYQTTNSWCYGGDPSNCDKYGRLYTLGAAKSACSRLGGGWRLPSDAEWTALVDAVNTSTTSTNNAGTRLKSTSGWNRGGNGTDDFGFSALPGGYRHSGGIFYSAGNNGYWWSATEYDAGNAWYRRMGYDVVYRLNWDKANALSVRCLRD